MNLCIDVCNACASACDNCASMCLKEADVASMVRCIELDVDCALLCRTAATLMGRGSDHAVAICKLCTAACQACADECSQHKMDHCQRCAEACRRCAEVCGLIPTSEGHIEYALDEALAETFPSSDPVAVSISKPSNTPLTSVER